MRRAVLSLHSTAALLMCAVLLAAGPAPTSAQDAPTAAVERIFRASTVEADWFAQAFLEQASAAQVEEIVERLTTEFGAFQDVSGSGEGLLVHLADADVPTTVRLDGSGRIATLFFEAPIPAAGSLEDHVAAIAALPGRTSVLVLTDGRVIAAHDAETVLAVGSAAKLAILEAVDDAVAAGRLRWDEVVAFNPSWRSLPTGILQDWPEATPLTVATLANLMISISDNTATDALIRIVGREAVEAVTPRNRPFLTTAEMFKLKAAGNEALRRDWLAADDAGQEAVLARTVALPLPTADMLGTPTLDIEWFMSATEICTLLDALAELPAMRINPGLARPSDWTSIAFKGGSDSGALNFSTALTGTEGTTHCVVATWNGDTGLDAERLAASYRGILRALAEPASGGRPAGN